MFKFSFKVLCLPESWTENVETLGGIQKQAEKSFPLKVGVTKPFIESRNRDRLHILLRVETSKFVQNYKIIFLKKSFQTLKKIIKVLYLLMDSWENIELP